MNLDRLRKNFEALAAEDPLWTVLSDNSKRGGKWDLESFFSSGEGAIRQLESKLSELDMRLGGGRALDFGCGVGRLSYPLAKRFQTVIGIDISESMLKEARRHHERGANCQFILNTTRRLDCLGQDSLDFAYSDIVFQHISPRDSFGYFSEIARCLKPGARFAFQLPSHLDPRSPDNQRKLRALRKRLHYKLKGLSQLVGLGSPYFEMNAIPRDKLIRKIEAKTPLRHLADWDYPAAGPNWISLLYLFEKAA